MTAVRRCRRCCRLPRYHTTSTTAAATVTIVVVVLKIYYLPLDYHLRAAPRSLPPYNIKRPLLATLTLFDHCHAVRHVVIGNHNHHSLPSSPHWTLYCRVARHSSRIGGIIAVFPRGFRAAAVVSTTGFFATAATCCAAASAPTCVSRKMT